MTTTEMRRRALVRAFRPDHKAIGAMRMADRPEALRAIVEDWAAVLGSLLASTMKDTGEIDDLLYLATVKATEAAAVYRFKATADERHKKRRKY